MDHDESDGVIHGLKIDLREARMLVSNRLEQDEYHDGPADEHNDVSEVDKDERDAAQQDQEGHRERDLTEQHHLQVMLIHVVHERQAHDDIIDPKYVHHCLQSVLGLQAQLLAELLLHLGVMDGEKDGVEVATPIPSPQVFPGLGHRPLRTLRVAFTHTAAPSFLITL